MLKKINYSFLYIILLLKEVVVANIQVAKIVLSPSIELDPCIVEFKSNLKSDLYRVVLANSITLTPGTITISLKDGVYTVHCLKKEFAEGLKDLQFEKLLMEMEAQDNE